MTAPNQASVPAGGLASAAEVDELLPSTWCVVACRQGCEETWTLDTVEFTPPLSTYDIERLLAPLLDAHDTTEHGKGW